MTRDRNLFCNSFSFVLRPDVLLGEAACGTPRRPSHRDVAKMDFTGPGQRNRVGSRMCRDHRLAVIGDAAFRLESF
ncbi:MAG: hypothetical protein AB7S70_06130 [Hyphomicrobium sp.]